MSAAHCDISYALIEGVFSILDGNVIYSGITYPVYKSIPKPSAETYIHICNVVHTEEGTKDSFIYPGTIQIQVSDESKQRADKTLALAILNVVRGLLKPARQTLFSISPLILVDFEPSTFNEIIEKDETGKSKIRLIEQYDFIIT